MDLQAEQAARQLYSDQDLHLAVLQLVGTTHFQYRKRLLIRIDLVGTPFMRLQSPMRLQGSTRCLSKQVLTLLLRPDGSLDPAYADSSPIDRLAHNVPFIMLHHMNHPRCAAHH